MLILAAFMDFTGNYVCPAVSFGGLGSGNQVSIADVVPESFLGRNTLLEVEIRFKK